MFPAKGKGFFHAVLQQAVVALGGVFQLGLLADGDGAFGQTLIADIVQVTLLNKLQRGFQAVTGIARRRFRYEWFSWDNFLSDNVRQGWIAAALQGHSAGNQRHDHHD